MFAGRSVHYFSNIPRFSGVSMYFAATHALVLGHRKKSEKGFPGREARERVENEPVFDDAELCWVYGDLWLSDVSMYMLRLMWLE